MTETLFSEHSTLGTDNYHSFLTILCYSVDSLHEVDWLSLLITVVVDHCLQWIMWQIKHQLCEQPGLEISIFFLPLLCKYLLTFQSLKDCTDWYKNGYQLHVKMY